MLLPVVAVAIEVTLGWRRATGGTAVGRIDMGR
jgi:hypothetical protein